MEVYTNTVTDTEGNIVNGATITVYNSSTGLPVASGSVFEADETTVLGNPFLSGYDKSEGEIVFAVANGKYDIKIENGAETDWVYGVTIFDGDDAAGMIDGVYGIETINFVTDADLTLTSSQYTNKTLVFTDTGTVLTADRNVNFPTDGRIWVIDNQTDYTLTVKTTSGTGIGIAPGDTIIVRGDGTNIVYNIQDLYLPANSTGNVSRKVMTTAAGGTGTEDGANTWAKLATYNLGTSNGYDVYEYEIPSTYGTYGGAALSVVIRQSGSGLDSSASSIQIHNLFGNTLSNASFKLIGAGVTNNESIELWINKDAQYGKFVLIETGKATQNSDSVVDYNNNAAWQSATPSGAVNVTSDYAGSAGVVESGSNANGKYIKFADGTMICTHVVNLQVSVIDTIETKIWTFPSAFIAAPVVACEVQINAATFSPTRTLNFVSSVLRAVSRANPTTAVEIFVSGSNAGVTAASDAIAIGRWK